MDGFEIPFLDSGQYSVHGHDLSHEEEGYSSREVSDEDIRIFDIGLGDVVLEFRDVLVQGRGVGSVFFKDHSFGCEPGDGGSSDVSLFKIFIELGNKVHVGSQGYSTCHVNGVCSESGSPSEGRAFGHIR